MGFFFFLMLFSVAQPGMERSIFFGVWRILWIRPETRAKIIRSRYYALALLVNPKFLT